MQFDFLEDKEEMRAFSLSVAVIVLTILAVFALVVSGGSNWIFYVIVIIAILLGFYLAYILSKTPIHSKSASRQTKRRKRGK
jgi:4-hydroxybenzoate polyprenyltransferase